MKTKQAGQHCFEGERDRGVARPPGTTLSRLLIWSASGILLVALFTPLWHYDFTAPQYPEGLPMTIYINHLGGRIDLVNELNHYVGMSKIDESAFPELLVMSWMVAILSVAGLAAGATRRLWALGLWLGVFATASLVLLGDFYWWLYFYGHNLNPRAAIRIAPFTPRLLGSYHLMNFQVTSYPGLGGIAMMSSFALGFIAFAVRWYGGRHRGSQHHAWWNLRSERIPPPRFLW